MMSLVIFKSVSRQQQQEFSLPLGYDRSATYQNVPFVDRSRPWHFADVLRFPSVHNISRRDLSDSPAPRLTSQRQLVPASSGKAREGFREVRRLLGHVVVGAALDVCDRADDVLLIAGHRLAVELAVRFDRSAGDISAAANR